MGSNRRGYERQMGELAKTQTQIAKQMWQLYGPNLQYVMGMAREQLDKGFGEPPKYIREAYDLMEGKMRSDYAKEQKQGARLLEQQYLQQGLSPFLTPAAKAQIMGQREMSLAEAQANALLNLRMQEAAQGLNTTMGLLNLLSGQGGQAGAMMNTSMAGASQLLEFLARYGSGNAWGNALAGAAMGGLSGYTTAGPWGAVIGALAGGIGGYYS